MPQHWHTPAAYASSLGEKRYSASLERGLAILERFTPERRLWGVDEIARELGMRRSTTHRYMATLAQLGYLTQDARRKYQLTLATTRLGLCALNSTSLAEHAHPHLQQLRQQTSYTTALAVLDGPAILYIERLPARRQAPGALHLRPGSRLPAHCTAMGKALLASLPEHAQRTLIAELQLRRRTPSTIASKTELRAELRLIAEEGIAINDQEDTPGEHAIAATIRDHTEALAAIAITASASTISLADMVEHLTPHLRATAAQISARLGHRRPDQRHHPPPDTQ